MRGLLSVKTVHLWPSKYSQNFSVIAHLSPRNSSFMELQLTGLRSVSLKPRLANAMGLIFPSCSWESTAPNGDVSSTSLNLNQCWRG